MQRSFWLGTHPIVIEYYLLPTPLGHQRCGSLHQDQPLPSSSAHFFHQLHLPTPKRGTHIKRVIRNSLPRPTPTKLGIERPSYNCQVTSHLDTQVTIETVLLPGSAELNPLVLNNYTFEFSKGLHGALSGICPRKQTNKWLKQFFTETGLDYSAWGGMGKAISDRASSYKDLYSKGFGF